jgi:Integrase core domain
MQHANSPLIPKGRHRMVLLLEERPRPGARGGGEEDLRAPRADRLERPTPGRRARHLPPRLDRPPRPPPRRSLEPPPVLPNDGDPPRVAGPGNLLSMEIKKLGRFEEPGHAMTGDRRRRSRRVGREYVRSIVVDCSRLAYAEIHDDEPADTVTAFTRRAFERFEERGVAVERLMTDNHFSYTKSAALAELLDRRAVSHLTIRPYMPRTSGKVERFHQTLMREWAYAMEYASSAAPTRRSVTGHLSIAFGTCWGSTATRLPRSCFDDSEPKPAVRACL